MIGALGNGKLNLSTNPQVTHSKKMSWIMLTCGVSSPSMMAPLHPPYCTSQLRSLH